MSKTKIMSKKKIIIFSILLCLAIIATFYFLGCHKNDFTDEINLNGLNEQQSTVKQKPGDGSTPSDHSPADNFAYALYDLMEAGSFVGESSGQTVSLGVEQNVKAIRYVNGDEVFKRSLSHSAFKSVGVEMFVSGKNYILRDATSLKSVDEVTWGADPYRVSEETFNSKFGGVPNGITAYVLTENSIVSAEFLGEENGIYAYRYVLDNALATTKIRLEMRTMAGTKTLPNFEEVALTVYMDANWRIQKTETACVYKVDMLGGVTCKESLTEVFSAIGEGKEIPDADIFRPYLDAEITEDDGEFTPDAMYYLTNGFNEYMTGKPLNLSLEIKGAINAVGSASVDIDANDLANIRARVFLDELSFGDITLKDLFVGYASGEVYAALGDFKFKTTVNELIAFIDKLMPLISSEPVSVGDMLSFNPDSLLTNATLKRENGSAVVTLPLELGKLDADIEIGFSDGDTVAFTGIYACVNGLEVSVNPVDEVTVPETGDDYLSIAPLLKLIDDDYNLAFKARLGETDVQLKFNLETMTLDAAYGDLLVKFENDVLYLNYGDLKAKADLNDLPALIEKFKPLFVNPDGTYKPEFLSDISSSLSDLDAKALIKQLTDNLDVVKTDEGVRISTAVMGANVGINLYAGESGYSLTSVSLSYGDLSIEAQPAEADEIPEISQNDLAEYKNILSLADIIDENGNINLSAALTAGDLSLNADLCIDLTTLTITAKTQLYNNDLYVKFSDGTVYASFKGLNVYADVDDIQSLLDRLAPLIGESFSLDGLTDLNIDIASVLSSLSFTESGSGLIASVSLSGINVSVDFTAEADNLKLSRISVSSNDFSLTAAPSAKADYSVIDNADKFYNILSLADIIDENYQINLSASLSGTEIAITLNLDSMRLNASVAGAAITFDINKNTLYAAYGGARVKLNLADTKQILEKFGPVIDKFDKDGKISGLLNGLLGDSAKSLNVSDILSSLTVSEGDGTLSLSLNVAGVDIVAIFATDGGGLSFSSATINASGTSISAHLTQNITPDLDTSLYYMDLKEFTRVFGDALNKLVTSENLVFRISGTVSTESAVYTITNGELVVGGIGSACKINADFTFVKKTSDASGNVTEKTNTLRFVYDLDAQEGYFNFNGIEGTFSTVDYNETLEILKQIYHNIPELQELISGIIPLSEDGKFSMPEFDFTKIISSLSLSDSGVLNVDVNAKSVIDVLPESIKLSLSLSDDGALNLDLDELVLGGTSVKLSVNAAPYANADAEGKFDYTPGENASDFSSVNTLLKTLATTSAYRHYELNGNLNLDLMGFINVNDKVKLNIKIDIVDGVTYVVATLTREYVFAANLAGMYPWSDYSGTSTLYYDGETKMIYIATDHIKSKSILGVNYKNGEEQIYEKYTEEEFSADTLNILLGMLRLSSKYRDMIGNANTNTSAINIEDIFTKYSYNGTDMFTLNLNLGTLTDNSLNDLTVNLHHDSDYNLSSLDVSTSVGALGIDKMLGINFSATHVAPYNHDNGVKEQVKLQPTLTDGNGNPLYGD